MGRVQQADGRRETQAGHPETASGAEGSASEVGRLPPQPAALGRRAASLVYELLLALAIVFFAAFPFHGAATADLSGWGRHAFQAYLFLVLGLYFVACWVRGGQTLPMKTWRLRVLTAEGTPLHPGRAVVRYLLAWVSVLSVVGLLWALVDRDRQFLHDRLAGTRIVKA